jgi:outer membrane protein OmpA-like peptidoglycan-associated protein
MKNLGLAATTAASLLAMASMAEAQMSGGPVTMAPPGGFSVDGAIGGGLSTMTKFEFGLAGAATPSGTNGSPAVRNRSGGQDATMIIPTIAGSYGLGTVMGMAADVYARYNYQDITQNLHAPANSSGSFLPTVSGGASGGFFGSFLTMSAPTDVARKQNNHDIELGGRVETAAGPFALRPGAFFSYNRLNQRDTITNIGNNDVAGWLEQSNVHSNYYRFGLGLGADMGLPFPGLTWINYGSASLDVVRSHFDAAERFVCTDCPPPAPGNAASGSKSGIGTHLNVYTGLRHEEGPSFSEFLVVGAQYISNVPYIVYPTLGSGGILGTGLSTTNANGPSHLANTHQINYGIMLGLNARFGVPAAPPAAAPPAPPPAAVAPQKQVFIVFFEFDKSSLTPDGRKVVDAAAAAFKSGKSNVAIAGYTDLAGTQQYNLALSKRRADTVKAGLVRDGVPAAAIEERWFGKQNPRVPTADGVREPQNRRVEVTM